MTDDWLAAVRRDLPAASRAAYLNAGTFGPVPAPAAEAMRGRIDTALRDGRTGMRAFQQYRDARTAMRELLAVALGTAPERIALTVSTTSGINVGLNGLDLHEGDEIVSTDAEHPGVDEPLQTAQRRRGVVVRRADALAADPADAVLSLLGPRTRAVVLSHVLWGTGRILPIEAIAPAAREQGAVTIVDGAQSAGAIPLRLDEVGADLYAVPGQKWLCGPSGTGGLYVRSGFEEALDVSQGSYFNRDHESDGEPFWPDARRFDVESLSTVAILGLAASLRWRHEVVGLEESFRRSQAAAAALRERLTAEPGVLVHPAPGPHAPLVAFGVQGVPAEEATEALDERGVLIRHLPLALGEQERCLRASVGFWASEDDLDRLLEGLRALRR